MRMYAEYFEKIYQFAEYGDYENFFIQLGYAIREKEFVSRVGAPLRNMTACNGEPIFKSDNLDLSKYKLLFEGVEKSSGDWLMVKELYGYAPQMVYNTYSAEPVQIPGITDPNGYLSLLVLGREGASSYDEQTNRYNIALSSEDLAQLNVGDLVKLQRYLYNSGATSNQIPGINSPTLPVLSKTATTYAIEAFEASLEYSTGNVALSPKDFIREVNNSNWGSDFSQIKTIREAATRTPSMQIVSIRNDISFSETFPALDSRMIISSGQNETDTITDVTNPNVTNWRQMVESGQYYNVQDAQVEIVFPKTFFKKIVKKTMAR